MGCPVCGTNLNGTPSFCPACGTNLTFSKTQILPVGFSQIYLDPEITTAARKKRKSDLGCILIFILLPLLGFPLAGLLVEDMPLNEAIIIGVSLATLVLVASLLKLATRTKTMWEGVVIDQKQQQKHRRATGSSGERIYESYTSYTTVIRTDQGRKKTIVEKGSNNHMYDYLNVNDRIRYHPDFATYEKYDKSKDNIIYCNVCSLLNPINNKRCRRCDNLLFK